MIEAWFDGCCEPVNPGGSAAYGALIKINGVTVFSEGVHVCTGKEASNNVAEYSGMLSVLRWIERNVDEASKITIRGDSKLVINQLGGKWGTNCANCGKKLQKCFCGNKTPGLYYPIYEQCKALYAVVIRRHKITLEWIPREQNEICDVLSKGVLKERGVEFKIQPETAT